MATNSLSTFVKYCKDHIKGDEKGEAKLFLDHFFMGLGYEDGLKGAGAECEFRLKDSKKNTSFADLVWKKRVLIEMKKAGENLAVHLQQATDYWLKLAGDRPRYVILCNFEQFWIYDFDKDIYDPVDVVDLEELPSCKTSFGFLLPQNFKPVFRKDKNDITVLAAKEVSRIYLYMVQRGVNDEVALHYTLQCLVTLFAEDVELLPDKIFTRIIDELNDSKRHPTEKVPESYDLIGELFNEMNTRGITPGGRFKGVDYFNGGIFSTINKIELTQNEIGKFSSITNYNWVKVNPAIFGTIFEGNLKTELRKKLGAHYTHEIDIKKIVNPVIVQPWMERIEHAQTVDDHLSLLKDLVSFTVLDPACGSGNFLFVAFREMKLLERTILNQLAKIQTAKDVSKIDDFLKSYPFVNTRQFYGIDQNATAVEVAKVTLMIAKELSILQQDHQYDNKFKPLPLDNLNENIVCCDALINDDGSPREWPQVDAIIGNPPFQSKNKMQREFGVDYLAKIRTAYPEVNQRADFCVYWFYRAHKHLKPGGLAGLVGTNTIRQNNSRESSLDYIASNGGEIFNAVSTQVWSGDAVVHVSIVNWKKGKYDGEKLLYYESKDGELIMTKRDVINPSLSALIDVTSAKKLKCNRKPKVVFQGQTHGHEGFLVGRTLGVKTLKKHPEFSQVLKPYLIGEDLLWNRNSQPTRFVIDLTFADQLEASRYKELYKKIELEVLPDVKEKAEQEKAGEIKANGHQNHLQTWWKMWRGREKLLLKLQTMKRYITCSRVTSRPIYEFVDAKINPNDAVMVFAFEDYYSFGIITSSLHQLWFEEKCSTMKGDPRYTTESVWDTFPWPQKVSKRNFERVATIAQTLHESRTQALTEYNMTLGELYTIIEGPGANDIKKLHAELDRAVIEAYGFDPESDLLAQLLQLNLSVADKEERGENVQCPGIPNFISEQSKYITDNRVTFIE